MWAKITWKWDVEKADVEYQYLHIPGLLFIPFLGGMRKHTFNYDFLLI